MVGVPARRIGWACECGVTLTLVEKQAVCATCGRLYRLEGELLTRHAGE
jgi:UDP-2-acetamido-3-amino-2,3-dideoxy-glucuronate N-acetyltransferase